MNKIIVICGPTASGKTGFAHFFAQNNNGEIINADSMQVYKQIPIITASPSDHLKNETPYHLYNFLDVDDECTLARYAALASDKVGEITARGKLPIIVGGTGLYISALINGFSNIPDIEPAIRAKVRSLQQSLSSDEFFNLLNQTDDKITNILHPGDRQRIARAYEVKLQTGKSILEYQENNIKPLSDFEFDVTMLLPDRQFLYAMCDKRLEELFASGAIEEAQALHWEFKDLKTSAMKALGVQEIIAYLEGKIDKAEALETAKLKTRRYAKRQITWFKNQIKEKTIISNPPGTL